MLFFIKRYLFGFIATILLCLISFITTVVYFDGLIPTIVGLTSIILILGFIPYSLKQDYNIIKSCFINLNSVRNGEMTKTDFSIDVIKKVCDETGLPEFMVNKVSSKLKINR